ncbi:MAG TPA: 2-amino-4-hydroxy-6-hydroxymethyldihydropteridine diphosphokinase [Arenimonas sp.]|nr:2-amino-4-hydroxy-6-hydroxymethyldihydropteridine diphosphokinase [Arenimonas sp.]
MSPPGPVPAWVALGGNQGDVPATFDAAVEVIGASDGIELLGRSGNFRTPAWGRTDQPDFINGVFSIRTTLAPQALLALLLATERRFGRMRADEAGRWGPRTLDLDLLVYGDQCLRLPDLELPHPRLQERAFVLVPLAQLAPGLVVPGQGRVDALLARVDATGIEAIP